MSLDRQFTKSVTEAIAYHSQTTSQLTKALKNLIKEDNIHVSYATSTQEFIVKTPFVPEPKSIKRILKITDSKIRAQWIEAIRRELKSIVEHTFNLDGQPLPGEQIIPLMLMQLIIGVIFLYR